MNKTPPEEQAALLSEEEKKQVKRYGWIGVLVVIPAAIISLIFLATLFNNLIKSSDSSVVHTAEFFDKVRLMNIVSLVIILIAFVAVVATLLCIKKKCPAYNDKLWRYLITHDKKDK